MLIRILVIYKCLLLIHHYSHYIYSIVGICPQQIYIIISARLVHLCVIVSLNYHFPAGEIKTQLAQKLRSQWFG